MVGKVLFSKMIFLAQSFLILAVLLASRPSVARNGEAGTGAGLSVASPTVPPGGLLQMQVFMTEPKPILKGRQGVRSAIARPGTIAGASAFPLGAMRDAAIFSSGGDVCGVAVIHSAGTQFFFSSPLETYGTKVDTPVITLAYPVGSTALAGQSVGLTLDANDSLWLDPKGNRYALELKSGAMTVGGTLSISDVVPGAGIIPAGRVISIVGVGFQPDSKVDFGEAKVATLRYLSSKLIHVTLRDAVEIRGQRIRIRNPDNERAVYFPYQLTKRSGKSTHPLVAAGYPLFSQKAETLGYFRPALHGTIFSGLALQNLNSTNIRATLQLYSNLGVLLSTRTLTLAPNSYVARDLVELFPAATPADGTRLRVTSNKGIQVLGLLGDDSSGMLLPVPASSKP
jgi:hypothetical protein